ncbi:MAG: hypothetical protein L0Z62_46610 [Gemmataceae bacterium]|nr:hypothetical protein [Gemmataceae bacterium]
MWTVLACLLTVGAGPAGGKLEILNPRATYGPLGALRPKGVGVLPGDVVDFRFDVKGMKFDPKGRASYSLLVEVLDTADQPLFRLGPINSVAQNFLGGDLMPCHASLEVPLDMAKGVCCLRVTVTDRATNRKGVFETHGKVLPADFGLVRVGTFADREGKVPTPPVGVVGESLYVNFSAVGFARAKDKKEPQIDVALRVLDDKGKPTMATPLSGQAGSDHPLELKLVPMQFGLTLNRAGRFTVELSATDRISGKRSQVTFPLRVLDLE